MPTSDKGFLLPGTRVGATLAAACAAASLALAGGPSAAGAPIPVGGPRVLAVSVPADPVPIRAGGHARAVVRALNPGRTPMVVTISGRTLRLGDNGKVSIGLDPDPRWRGLVRFPAGELTIPADGSRDIPLTIRVPRGLPPDLYFVGFVVSPVPTRHGSIRVINQIGSFVTIDVPGPRLRKLAGRFDMPSVVLGSHVSGTLRITNVGDAATRFWGENDSTSSPGGSFGQLRLDPSVLPRQTSRTIAVSGKPAWPIGVVTITAHVTYPGRTDAVTRELTFTKRVLVVNAWVPAGLGLLALGTGLGWSATRRRRSRPGGPAAGH